MYCSHCGKKLGEDMRFCPFCGRPIVIPEQDDTPAPVSEAPAAPPEPRAAEQPEPEAPEKPTSVLDDAPEPSPEPAFKSSEEAEKPLDDATAELLDWSRERRTHMTGDVWARPEAPEEDFAPLKLDEGDEPAEEPDWREEIARKKQAAVPEKKPPEMKHKGEPPVRLEGSAPKLDAEEKQPARSGNKGQKPRKRANTLVPPKTMDPEDIFMDDRKAAYDEDDPYDSDAPDDGLAGSFSFEDDDEGSFFMRHLRGIVGLALFAILLLLIVIFAFSKAGQVSLARVNAAWSKDAYSTLGYQYFQAGNYSEAGRYYERALQRDPDSYSFASSAAMAYLQAGDDEKAAAMLKRCAQIDPTKLEPYIYLLKLYPDAASRPWDVTQLLQQGYQRTGDTRLNVSG